MLLLASSCRYKEDFPNIIHSPHMLTHKSYSIFMDVEMLEMLNKQKIALLAQTFSIYPAKLDVWIWMRLVQTIHFG